MLVSRGSQSGVEEVVALIRLLAAPRRFAGLVGNVLLLWPFWVVSEEVIWFSFVFGLSCWN